jgi:hypothetical protein
MTDSHIDNLKKFQNKCEHEIDGIELKRFSNPSQDSNNIKLLKEDMREILTSIALDGNVKPYSWPLLKNYLAIAIKDSLFYMNDKYPDCPDKMGENFDDILGDLIELFMLFD